MIDFIAMVREFHKKYGHHIQDRPFWPPYEIIELRNNLIDEEADEFIQAETLVEVADAIADLLYVTFGAAISYGIPIEEVFTEVHNSNMTKSTETNEFGKTIKGPDFREPDVRSILRAYKFIS